MDNILFHTLTMNKDVVMIGQPAFALAGDKKTSIAAGCTKYLQTIKQSGFKKNGTQYFSEVTDSLKCVNDVKHSQSYVTVYELKRNTFDSVKTH